MRQARGWVLGGMLSLLAWTVGACEDNPDKVAVEIVGDAGKPDSKPAPTMPPAPDSAQPPDAGVDSALPDRAAPDAAMADSGSDALDTDGFSVTVNPNQGTITESY
jgi:hypothetical protein